MRHRALGVRVLLVAAAGVALACFTTESRPPDAATARASLRDAESYVHLRLTRDGLDWRATTDLSPVRWTPFTSLGRLTQDDPKGSMSALKALHRFGPIEATTPGPAVRWPRLSPAGTYRLLVEAGSDTPWRHMQWVLAAVGKARVTLLGPSRAYVDLAEHEEDDPGPETERAWRGLLRRAADGPGEPGR